MPQTIAHPYREQSHCKDSHLGQIFPNMFPRKVVPFLDQPRNRNRIKNICFQPCAKCNMPSSPEFRCISGKKRLPEILRKIHTKKVAAADHDIHTAGKFHIKLKRICNGDNHDHNTMIAGIIVINRCYQNRKSVRHNNFFEQSPGNTDDSLCKIFASNRSALPECICCIIPAADRSLHDLRKKAQEKGYFAKIMFCFDPAPVNICHIANCLQRIERNSYRDQKVLWVQMKAAS